MLQNTREFEAFNADVKDNSGYLYTTNARLSSRLANKRLSDAALRYSAMEGKRVIDIGCGDGTYTLELYDRSRPATLLGVDPAADAIGVAKEHTGKRDVSFDVQNAYALPYADRSFDIAQLRGVLHHMDDARAAIHEALRVAHTVIIIEPNGYNLILKALEKLSSYHVKHGEKSYPPSRIDKWARLCGARIVTSTWVGLVPFFCPDWMARVTKAVEPIVEHVPLLNKLGCAVYVVVAQRD